MATWHDATSLQYLGEYTHSDSMASDLAFNTRDVDSDYLVLDEIESVAPDWGFYIAFDFRSIPETVENIRLLFTGRYEGSPSHNVRIEVMHYPTLSWHDLAPLSHSTTDISYTSIDLGADYISSTGGAKIRIVHYSEGIVGHKLWVNKIHLEDRTAFAPPVDTPIISPTTGEYLPTQEITITSGNADNIYYTTDGSTPDSSDIEYTAPIPIFPGTLKAIGISRGFTDSNIASEEYTLMQQTEIPEANLPSGEYSNLQEITLTSDTPTATIYYTTDGSTPDSSDIEYTSPIPMFNGTLKAVAIAPNYYASDIMTKTYSQAQAESPEADTLSGEYISTHSITLTSGTPTATIYYTTDGSLPDSSDIEYTSSIPMFTGILKAIAIAPGYIDSTIMTETYTVSGGAGRVQTPTPQPEGGTYPESTTIALIIFGIYPGTIYYSTDGSYPTIEYTSPIPMFNGTLKAIGISSTEALDSFMLTEIYTIEAAVVYAEKPVANIDSGVYASEQTIILSTGTETATIYYTLDGTIPNNTSFEYTTPITMFDGFLTAIAIAPDFVDSAILQNVYTIESPTEVATPIISPPSGSYETTQEISIFCGTSGATIYYTTDGTDPTTSSIEYTVPFTLTSAKTIKAIGTKTELLDSSIVTEVYTINAPNEVSTPIILPISGSYSLDTITISCVTSGATIYYTTDGTDPTNESIEYVTPIEMFTGEIKAIGIKNEFIDSTIVSAEYVLVDAEEPPGITSIVFRGGTGSIKCIQDLYICTTIGDTNNDFLGDCRVDLMVPNGKGSITSGVPYPEDVSNWENVDDYDLTLPNTLLPCDFDETFNDLMAAGNKELYALSEIENTSKLDVQYIYLDIPRAGDVYELTYGDITLVTDPIGNTVFAADLVAIFKEIPGYSELPFTLSSEEGFERMVATWKFNAVENESFLSSVSKIVMIKSTGTGSPHTAVKTHGIAERDILCLEQENIVRNAEFVFAIQNLLLSGSTFAYGTATILTNIYEMYSSYFDLDPATGLKWKREAIDIVETGVKTLRVDGTGENSVIIDTEW